MNDITAITCNWLTATRTLRAIQSFKKFYPDTPFLVIDDGSNPKDEKLFRKIYREPQYRGDLVYDPDNSKLKNIPGVKYIQVPTHRRHGESIDYALSQIKTKWVFHIDSDVRILKKGAIEHMMKGVDDTYCGIGFKKIQKTGYPNVACAIFIFKASVAKRFKHLDAVFTPLYGKGLQVATRYFKVLTDKGYKIKYCTNELRQYYTHLRFSNKRENEWHKHY